MLAPDQPVPLTSSSRTRSNQGSPSSPSGLLSLPDEILEQVFLLLNLNDRLRLRLACTALRDTYVSSAQLQYRFTLDTSAYLDVPFALPTSVNDPNNKLNADQISSQQPSSSDIADEKDDGLRSITLRSPHTGRARQTISSVSLAPWSKEPSKSTINDLLAAAAAKNEVLRTREKRWETLDWGQKRTFKVQGREGVYELQEGVFLMCDDFNDLEDDKPSTIRLVPLPSDQDPDLEDPPIQTKATKVPFPISDLTMDPTQDLIVVSEYRPETSDVTRSPPTHRYHLLTLSTFEPHPLASLPTLDFPPFTQAIMDTRQLLQVMGDTLLVLVSRFAPAWVLAGLGLGIGALGGLGHEEELVAWNWKNGKVLARMSLPENGWFSSFALLTPTTLMVTSTSNISPLMPSEPRSHGHIFPPVIQIYSFASDPNNPMNPVQPLDTDPMDDTTPRPVLLAQLELPKLAHNVMVTAFDVRPDPAFPPHLPESGPTLGKGKHFTQDPSKGILVFELRVMTPNDAEERQTMRERKKCFELFVLRETLVRLAKQGEERLQSAWDNGGDYDGLGIRGVEQTISWEKWGETGARLMDAVMKRRSWVCSCSGYRFISLSHAVRPEGHGQWPDSEDEWDSDDDLNELMPPPRRSDLHLLDFSPVNIRRDQVNGPVSEVFPSSSQRSWAAKVHDTPSALEKKNIWKEDVISGLPFREVRRHYGGLANGIMCDDQRVIVIHTSSRMNGDWSNITQEMTVLCM